ncbi:MAG: hypothetical protein GY950_18670 [bacterium]|nr:hypothetical protein [bacterium]
MFKRTIPVDGLTLFFEEGEEEAAGLIGDACKQSVGFIGELWGLEIPAGLRVYVMTDWRRFLFHSAPWPRRIMLGLLVPLLYSRYQRVWKVSGGWNVPYKKPAVGIKPPRLLEEADSGLGAEVFFKEEDRAQRMRFLACHELTHAFTTHLRLPMWLNEGLAMVTVDALLEKITVKPGTLKVLQEWSQKTDPGRYRKISVKDKDSLVYHFVRGYWITRYIRDKQPELLNRLLSRRRAAKALEEEVAAAFDMDYDTFWNTIDGTTAAHFSEKQ